MSQCPEKGTRQKWELVYQQVGRELHSTMETNDLKQQFSNGYGSGAAARKPTATEQMNVNIVTPDQNIMIQPRLPMPNKKRQPAFERFGGNVPFQHHSGSVDNYFGNDIDDDDSNNKFFVARRNNSNYGGMHN